MATGEDQGQLLLAGLRAAQEALKENQRLLDPEKNKIAYNWNIALAAMMRSQARVQDDVDLLHRKLQPVLKYLEEELGDRRSRHNRYDAD